MNLNSSTHILKKIVDDDVCAGCGLCASIVKSTKVEMKINQTGHYRPAFNGQITKAESDILKKVCPAISVKEQVSDYPNFDSIWGGYHSCAIAASSNEEIRTEASSGGVITAILHYLLSTNKIEAVVHIGASSQTPYMNEVKISKTLDEIIQHANSRYSPSSPLVNIIEQTRNYHRIAFVGKPCDVAALRQYARYGEELRDKTIYYLSFFCAGVPSLNATLDLAKSFNIDREQIKQLDYRKEGWPGHFRVYNKNGDKYTMSYHDSWAKKLGPFLQFRCKVCPDAIGHIADITCADAWNDFDATGYPTFRNRPGQSLVFTRTKVGEAIFHDALSTGFLTHIKNISDCRIVDQMQPGQLGKKYFFFPRQLALAVLFKHFPSASLKFYFGGIKKAPIITQIRNFTGAFRRIILKRIQQI